MAFDVVCTYSNAVAIIIHIVHASSTPTCHHASSLWSSRRKCEDLPLKEVEVATIGVEAYTTYAVDGIPSSLKTKSSNKTVSQYSTTYTSATTPITHVHTAEV